MQRSRYEVMRIRTSNIDKNMMQAIRVIVYFIVATLKKKQMKLNFIVNFTIQSA